MTNQNAETFTVADLVKRWQVHEVTLRRMLERGELPAFKLGRSWRITAATVAAVEQNELPLFK